MHLSNNLSSIKQNSILHYDSIITSQILQILHLEYKETIYIVYKSVIQTFQYYW